MPGTSGNPGGRPKSLLAAIEARRPTIGEDLVHFWCLIAFGTEAEIKKALGAKPRIQDRAAAANELADRVYGKAKQTVEVEGHPSVPVYMLPPGCRGVSPF